MPDDQRSRVFGILFSAVMIGLVYMPITQNWAESPKDGFPFSYYPMFTSSRGATTTLHHVVATTRDNRQVNVPSRFIGPGGMNTVRRQMRKLCRDGKALDLVTRVADRLSGSKFAEKNSVVRLEVVESKYSLEAFFVGDVAPEQQEVLATVKLN